MIFSHGVHGELKAFSQNERMPFWYASGFSAIHLAGCLRIVSSGTRQPHPGQIHEIPPLSFHDFLPRILVASGSKWMESNTIS